MLDITTNQAAANSAYCSFSLADEAAAAAELLLDDEMVDPLFEEDWLHENNLDILFDLFEEEIESKVGVESSSASSTLYGSSPVTSYLFGTSPTMASALDLIYFDNQQPSISSNVASTSTETPTTTASSLASNTCNGMTIKPTPSLATTTLNAPAMNQVVINHAASANVAKQSTYNVGIIHNVSASGVQQVNQVNVSRSLTNSITNSMRIKRGFKKGQSEGVSLLAKPCLSNSGRANGNNSGSSGNISSNNNKNNNSKNNARRVNNTTSKNISDKTSAKIKNFKSSIIIGNTSNSKNIENNRNVTDINYSKQSQQPSRDKYYLHKCQQHVHYITGRSVIHEHAYAVRGH